jgi:hypothetical protein
MSDSVNNKYYNFAYSFPFRESEELRPVKARDGTAFCELTAPLQKQGWEYGSLIYNYPLENKDIYQGKEHFDFLGPKDLIVITTRPPLSDEKHCDKKRVLPSHTYLEKVIFKELNKYFEVCARSYVEIESQYHGFSKYSGFKFSQANDARLKSFRKAELSNKWERVPDTEYRAIGFFLRLNNIDYYNCGLLSCFSMGGIETLIWNRIVRKRYHEWLQKPCFIVAEFNIGELPVRPINLDFVEKIDNVDILLNHFIE